MDLLVKDLKLFRRFVRLRGLTAMFWDMTRLINKHKLIMLVGRTLLKIFVRNLRGYFFFLLKFFL